MEHREKEGGARKAERPRPFRALWAMLRVWKGIERCQKEVKTGLENIIKATYHPEKRLRGEGAKPGSRESRQEHQFWREMLDTWFSEWWKETER